MAVSLHQTMVKWGTHSAKDLQTYWVGKAASSLIVLSLDKDSRRCVPKNLFIYAVEVTVLQVLLTNHLHPVTLPACVSVSPNLVEPSSWFCGLCGCGSLKPFFQSSYCSLEAPVVVARRTATSVVGLAVGLPVRRASAIHERFCIETLTCCGPPGALRWIHSKLPADFKGVRTMDLEEAVILVVGAATEYKARVADALGKGRGATEVETTKGGARIFRRKLSPDAVIVETTPFLEGPNGQHYDMAKAWMSANGLRRLSGKLVCMVWVVTSSHTELSALLTNPSSWYCILEHIFEEQRQAVMVLVGTRTSDSQEATRAKIIDLQTAGFARSQISFETLERTNLLPNVRTVLELSVYHGEKAKQNVQTMTPFRLQEETWKGKDVDRYGVWGAERVILFGRTGSGKSTLCQMLTKGRPDPLSDSTSSSGIRGETKEIKRVEGRGWYVIDTPGFGEPKDDLSTISTEDAEKMLEKYVKSIDGIYTHFIYVVMKDRIDMLETALWKFFKLLFNFESSKKNFIERSFMGEFKIERNFTVVVSNATKKWVDDNLTILRENFDGCDSFVGGEFPPLETADEEWETELAEIRTDSLKQLEDELAGQSRCPCYTQFGFYSKSTRKAFSSQLTSYARGRPIEGVSRATMWAVTQLAKGSIQIGGVMAALKKDKKIILLPPLT